MSTDITAVFSDWISRSAALGTAAMGLVEALKFTPLGVIGLGRAKRTIGATGMAALESVYTEKALDTVLRGTFRISKDALAELLRNGLRLGLSASNADALATQFGVDAASLKSAISLARAAAPGAGGAAAPPVAPGPATDAAVAALARFHSAVDARVDAAAAAAHETYLGALRVAATLVALAASLFMASYTGDDNWVRNGFLIGLVAVPIAPISKEVLSLLRAAASAVTTRGA